MKNIKLDFKTFILPFLLFLITAYTVIWSVWEPFPYLEECRWKRFYIILTVSFFSALYASLHRGMLEFYVFKTIRPFFLKKSQTLSTDPADDALSQDWFKYQTSLSRHPKLVNDDIFGKSVLFSNEITFDAFREFNGVVKSEGRKIDFFFKYGTSVMEKTPVIYLRMEMQKIIGNEELAKIEEGRELKNTYKWLALIVNGIEEGQVKKVSDSEQIHFISPQSIYKEWMFFTVNVQEAANSIKEWQKEFRFSRLIGIKTRGNFELGVLTVYR